MSYLTFYNKITDYNCTEPQLQYLKEIFKTQINSNRRYDLIKNLKDLVRILEKRDCLNEENIQILYNIATHLNISLEDSNQTNYKSETERRIYDLICQEIGLKWKDFARNLGIRNGQIDDISREPRISDSVYKILSLHKNNSNPQTRLTEILTALEKTRRNDLKYQIYSICNVWGPL